ncbi:Uncharacterised protein [Starkeya nomas]|uniref:Outer membrane protein beta-barrel domain-containing protein n=2 Tax=Starkeya nomas TaxID=2666134 RepID=A0A5S9PIE1_9HYPH|nr:Uncharacterised protein [Starkeya nomas]
MRRVASCRKSSRYGAFALMTGLLGASLLAGHSARADEAGLSMDDDDLLAKAPKIEDTSGWYLRGDVGYVFNETPDGLRPGFGLRDSSLDDAWLVGIGAGVRLNDMFRVDVTADYRTSADYAATGVTADFSATTVLANVYADLGTWHGITPYVGAGIGGGYVSASDIRLLGLPAGDSSGWGLAWALTAGAAVTVAPNWQVDVGYRYINLEEAGGGRFDFGQSAHEVRIGLRYLID